MLVVGPEGGVAPDEIEPHVGRLAAVTDDLARTMGTAPDPGAAVIEVLWWVQGALMGERRRL